MHSTPTLNLKILEHVIIKLFKNTYVLLFQIELYTFNIANYACIYMPNNIILN